MKSHAAEAGVAAPIVLLAQPGDEAVDSAAEGLAILARARAFAEPLLVGHTLDSGEPALAHADGVARVLEQIGQWQGTPPRELPRPSCAFLPIPTPAARPCSCFPTGAITSW